MNNRLLQLQSQLFENQLPSRELIIEYLRAIVEEAQKLPIKERDDLAYEVLRPFIEKDYSLDSEPDIDYIVFQLGSNLDILSEDAIAMGKTPEERRKSSLQKAHVWDELISKVKALSE